VRGIEALAGFSLQVLQAVSPAISNFTEESLQHANKDLYAAELIWASKGQSWDGINIT
jgi:hypothetical protein